jgi:hypothetical protein
MDKMKNLRGRSNDGITRIAVTIGEGQRWIEYDAILDKLQNTLISTICVDVDYYGKKILSISISTNAIYYVLRYVWSYVLIWDVLILWMVIVVKKLLSNKKI